MDAFIDSTIQLLIEWGLPGLFISALLAGSIVPFSSELVLVALVKLGLPPIACLISATLGNTVGGMTCYYMGRLGKISWIEKYFKKISVANAWSAESTVLLFLTFPSMITRNAIASLPNVTALK